MNNHLKHVVFVNGPPRSGKDTTAEIAIDYLGDEARIGVIKFAQPLRDAMCSLFGIKDEDVELWKQTELSAKRHTGRDVMIALSEVIVKPMLDRCFFGKRAADVALRSSAEVILVTDAGFDYEVASFIDEVKDQAPYCQFTLIQLHRDGCSFEGDSRGYIGLNDDLAYFSVVNTSLAKFTRDVQSIMSDIVRGPGDV
jgi:hypothetical protein